MDLRPEWRAARISRLTTAPDKADHESFVVRGLRVLLFLGCHRNPQADSRAESLTPAPLHPNLEFMEVHFTPELEKKIHDLAVQRGQETDELVQDAIRGYFEKSGHSHEALDWSQCPAAERVPDKVSGAWVLRGTRMPVATIFENLEAGANIDNIIEWFDGLDREQVKSVIDFAARSLATPARSG
jgi:uncharacterized protein (DUF433 family)